MTTTKTIHHASYNLLTGLFLLLLTSVTQAAPVFIGESIDISYTGTDYLIGTDTIIAGDNDPDIAYRDGSNIGNGLMLDFESIDFADTSVTFTLRGDGPSHSSGYQTTGLNGSYAISLVSAGISITNLSIGSINDMIGVNLGTEITYDARNIYFDISTLGILETSGADIGSITLDVDLLAVPLPAALPLMLSGLTGLALFSRRRKNR